jgi:hypothetical protein
MNHQSAISPIRYAITTPVWDGTRKAASLAFRAQLWNFIWLNTQPCWQAFQGTHIQIVFKDEAQT